MTGCKVDAEASPQFNILRDYSKKNGYPSVTKDLEEAFTEIRKNIQAKHCRVVPRFSSVLGNFLLFKYRQKNSAAREGASGGWRFYALFDKATSTLYPIVLYPKKAWQDAHDDIVKEAVEQILSIVNASGSLF